MKYFLMHFPIILHNGLQKTVSQCILFLRVGMGQGPITSWPEARGFLERSGLTFCEWPRLNQGLGLTF